MTDIFDGLYKVVVGYNRIPRDGLLAGMTLSSTVRFPDHNSADLWIATAQFNTELSDFRKEDIPQKEK
jgi:hypothetical protein